jgi:hypothetical protein
MSNTYRTDNCLRILLAAVALTALTATGITHAMCVSTAQELQDALTLYSDGGSQNGNDLSITLVQGTYTTGSATSNGPFTYKYTAATGSVEIVGGATDSQCEGATANAALTILDGQNATQVLNISNTNQQVYVEYLTIQNGETSAVGGGLYIDTETALVYVGYNIIQNNHSTTSGGGLAVFAGGSESQLDVLTNVVVNNSADAGEGAGILLGNNVDVTYVTSNTVFGNSTVAPNGIGGLLCCGTAGFTPFVYYNIFWQNTNYGLSLDGEADLAYNDIGILGGSAPTQNVGNTSVGPKFVDDANVNFHLAGNSPLLGYAPAYQGEETANDVAGSAFPQAGKRDLGAYAETIFVDGFDGN